MRPAPGTVLTEVFCRAMQRANTWGLGSYGTASRLKRLVSPVTVRAFHAGMAFREAVAVVCLAGDVAQQFVHPLVQRVVVAVGHLQLVLAVGGQLPGVVSWSRLQLCLGLERNKP